MGDKAEQPRIGLKALIEDSNASQPDPIESTVAGPPVDLNKEPATTLNFADSQTTLRMGTERVNDIIDFGKYGTLEEFLDWLKTLNPNTFFAFRPTAKDVEGTLTYGGLIQKIQNVKKLISTKTTISDIDALLTFEGIPGLLSDANGNEIRGLRRHILHLISRTIPSSK